jgi:hypothetical protein
MPWPAQLDVLLRPGEIRVARRPAWLPSRGRVMVQAYPVTAAQPEENWRASVEVLGMALGEQTAARSVRVFLSDHFVRYALVPWNESLVADAERLAFARLALGEIYGSMAEGWAVAQATPSDRRAAAETKRLRVRMILCGLILIASVLV